MESNLSAQTATLPTQADHCEWAGIILGSLDFREHLPVLPSVGTFSTEPN